jgi:RNA polymerase sigma-70 factor (ECF subfamily)
MARYAAGDEAAFAVVYDALAPRLYGFLLRQTGGDAARADDLVQQTFLQMHRARGSFVAGAEVVPWAFAIARRLVIDGYRRGRREVLDGDDAREEPPASQPAADDLVQAQEIATRIRRELARLPEGQRAAFELVKQEGLSLAEAAQALGTTVAAVKLRAHRAYEALRAVLGDVLEERRS